MPLNHHGNLLGYLPDIMQGIREMKAIMAAEQVTSDQIWDAAEKVFRNQYIQTADEYGIGRLEKMLGITPYGTDTLGDRRFRLLAMYGSYTPYTRKHLEQTLTALCGAGGHDTTYNNSGYSMTVLVALTAKRQVDTIKRLLESILPLNMEYAVQLKYNRWSDLLPVTWGSRAAQTWDDVRNEVIS